MKTTKQTINAVLRHARASEPDLWARTEAVARIIAPEAFQEDWVVEPPSAARLHLLRLQVLQGNAMAKAQAVLTYLGVNTDADWYDILHRLADAPRKGSQ